MIKNKLVPYLTGFVLSVLFSTSMNVHATTKEQAVKAGVIYNITKFVVWPSHANDKFNLCVFGDDKLGGSLEALYGKRVGSQKIVLRRNVAEKSLTECHVAFIAHQNDQDIQNVLTKLKSLPILTISDNAEFIDHGGMVGLVRDDLRVGFEFDLTAVRSVGLNVGAQLLKLAKRVKELK